MVCATINRDPRRVDDNLAKEIRDGLHKAIVEIFKVKPEDVEIRVRNLSVLDLNSGALAIDVDSGPGQENWRLDDIKYLLMGLNKALEPIVPQKYRNKRKSNLWLRIYAKGVSMPIGCLEELH